ncbi:hypothetical protein [Nitrospira sp. Kam-Ns4a]
MSLPNVAAAPGAVPPGPPARSMEVPGERGRSPFRRQDRSANDDLVQAIHREVARAIG